MTSHGDIVTPGRVFVKEGGEQKTDLNTAAQHRSKSPQLLARVKSVANSLAQGYRKVKRNSPAPTP